MQGNAGTPLLRNQITVTVGAQDTLLIGPNDKRVSILIGSPRSVPVTISLVGPAVKDQGLRLPPGTLPLQLLYMHIGQAVREEIRAIADSGQEIITVVEFLT